MKASTIANSFQHLENELKALRRKIHEGSDPKAIPTAAALVCFDAITRIRGYSSRVDTALAWELCSPGFAFEKNVRRLRRALPILRRLTAMEMRYVDGLLSCAGGCDAIAVQSILESTKDNPNERQVLLQILATPKNRAKTSRQKSKRCRASA